MNPSKRQAERIAKALAGPREKSQPKARKPEVPFWPEYRGRELDFIRDKLGRKTGTGELAYWRGQEAMVRGLFEKRYLHVRGGRKNGKSHALADIALTALYTRPSTVIVISSGWSHLRDVLFAQIGKAHEEAHVDLAGEPLQTSIRLGPRHYCIGAAYSTSDRAQGHHAGVVVPDDPNRDLTDEEVQAMVEQAVADGKTHELFLLFDECPGIEERVFAALEGSMSGSNVYVGMFCNPTLDQTDPHPAVRYGLPGSRYHRIKISHLSEELFPDPVPADEVFDRGFGEHGDRGVPNWIRDDRWIAQQAHDFGEGSAHFRSYVLGQFADAQAGDRVITGAMLEACSHEQNVPEPVEHLGVGIDLAATEDESVAVLVRGGVVLDLYAWRAAPGDVNPTMSGVDEIQALIPRWEKEHGVRIPHRAIHIDSGGLGRGPAERLVQLGLHVDLVDFGTKPAKGWRDIIGPHVFKNTRAELYWTLRRLLQERLLLIPDRPEFHELRRELLWARWMHVEVGGETAIQLEPKTDIIKRHGRSPDHADALALAMRRPPSPPAFGTYGEKFSTTHLPGPRSSDDGWEPFTGLTT